MENRLAFFVGLVGCISAVLTCGPKREKCEDGIHCIWTIFKCDGEIDCKDGSDERADICKDYTCGYGMEKCDDGVQCISPGSRCDGYKDCNDGSDEIVEVCREYECKGGYMKCPDGVQCLVEWGWCDGDSRVDKCPDLFDEDPTFCKNYTCPADMVKCKDNLQCVSKDHFMSGYEECHDYSDEDLEYAKFILKDEFEYTTTLIY